MPPGLVSRRESHELLRSLPHALARLFAAWPCQPLPELFAHLFHLHVDVPACTQRLVGSGKPALPRAWLP